jgi:alkanesulfonate monooxygenase SsuD/methylene tetrahydromethanopterin reductase-like flavin-dependent oxidoreductase (luciferase family)
MQIGLLLPNVTALRAAEGVRRCVQLGVSAERLGYDAVWLGDHVVAPPRSAGLARAPAPD